MKPLIKAIVFDVFNTLFHNEPPLWERTFREICQAQGLNVYPKALRDRWRAFESQQRKMRVILENPASSPPFVSYREMWTACFDRAFSDFGLKGDSSAATSTAFHDLTLRQPFPETFSVLGSLRQKYSLAILSNADTDFLYPLLQRYPFPFDLVLCSEELQLYKPHPSTFKEVLKRLGLRPEQALHVGDSMTEDIQGSKMAGLWAAWINRDGMLKGPLRFEPDYELNDLTELPPAIEKS